jgi:hypothetical protein
MYKSGNIKSHPDNFNGNNENSTVKTAFNNLYLKHKTYVQVVFNQKTRLLISVIC